MSLKFANSAIFRQFADVLNQPTNTDFAYSLSMLSGNTLRKYVLHVRKLDELLVESTKNVTKKNEDFRPMSISTAPPVITETVVIRILEQSLFCWLWLAIGTGLVQPAMAQTTTNAVADSRFFTTTGISLAFPVGSLRMATQNGRGTSFTLEYKITPVWSIAGAWDSNTMSIQSAKLLTKLDPSLLAAIADLKGDYMTNVLGLSGIRYVGQRRVRAFLTSGIGLNIITVPAPKYNLQTQLLSLESASHLTLYAMAGLGISWQFSKPVSIFGEIDAYVVPAETTAAQSNSFLTTKIGLRFPLF